MPELILAILVLYRKYRDRIWQFSYTDLDLALQGKEKQHGRLKWGLLLTVLFLLATFLYVRPASHCAFMGEHYAKLANNPFAFDSTNPIPHRILTSLISYLIGLRGHLIIFTNLLFAGTFIFAVYWYFRKIAPRPADAFFAAAIMAFSLVTLITVYYGGYNDSLTYLLIFLMWLLKERRLLFYLLFFLGLLNREAVVFLVPWFVLISMENVDSKKSRLFELFIGLGTALGLYFLFRYWLAQHQDIGYSLNYYFDPFGYLLLKNIRLNFPNLGLGLFGVFKLMWIIPLLASVVLWREGNRQQVWSLVLIIICATAQTLVAYDTTRLMALSFMVMPISLGILFSREEESFRRWLIPVFAFNLLVPNLYAADGKIEVMHSLLTYAIEYATR